MTSYAYPPQGAQPQPQQQPQQQPQYQQPAQPYPPQQPMAQPQYQQPAQPYPPQGAQPQYQQPAQPYPPQAGAPAPQQAASQGMPEWHEPDDEAARQAYAQTSVGGGFGPTPQFLKVPGPRGQQTWDSSVPVGHTGSIHIRILPPWAAGKPHFVESRTIFYKSNKYPKGRVLGFEGEDSLYMRAIAAAANSGDPRLQRVATDYGRVRTQYLYNVLDLTHPESHTGQDGVMRPYLLGAGKQLHKEIGETAETRGGSSRLVSPVHGRPLKYSKTKHGPDMMNIEYSIIDLEPEPLHPYFHGALSNLWDLEAQIPTPTQDEVLEAIRELGLPNPTQTMAQVPQGYMAQPQYQQPAQPMAQPMAQAPQGYMAQPMAQPTAAYQPDPNPPHASPYATPPPQQPAAYPAMPDAAQAPQYGAGVGSAPPPLPGQMPPVVPSMAPPPVQSHPEAAPPYPVQAGGGQPPF